MWTIAPLFPAPVSPQHHCPRKGGTGLHLRLLPQLRKIRITGIITQCIFRLGFPGTILILAEALVIGRAVKMLEENKNGPQKPVMIYVDMSGKEVADEGMICGGAVEVLLETV